MAIKVDQKFIDRWNKLAEEFHKNWNPKKHKIMALSDYIKQIEEKK